MSAPTPPPPEHQRAAVAVSAVTLAAINAKIDGLPFPVAEVEAILAGLDLDARCVAEEMLGEQYGDDFRTVAGAIPPGGQGSF